MSNSITLKAIYERSIVLETQMRITADRLGRDNSEIKKQIDYWTKMLPFLIMVDITLGMVADVILYKR